MTKPYKQWPLWKEVIYTMIAVTITFVPLVIGLSYLILGHL